MRRRQAALLAVWLMLVLAACGTPAPPQASVGEGEALTVDDTEMADYPGEAAQDAPQPAPSREQEGPGDSSEPAPASHADESSASPAQPAGGEVAVDDGAGTHAPDGQPLADEGEDGMLAATVTVAGRSFSALLYDNEASRSLLGQMPLTVGMADLNRNEKYCSLPENLHDSPTESPATIRAGEIMCWSGNCLVLFYDSFANAYGGYVRMGYLEDPDGLADALGPGSVTVTFSAA